MDPDSTLEKALELKVLSKQITDFGGGSPHALGFRQAYPARYCITTVNGAAGVI